MSVAPGTSRSERQAAQDAANRAAAEAAEKAASMPGGGINQPQYAASGGPTWADTPAGRELRKQYEKSGVVFDSRGNIIYNPADLGAAEVERARAARGQAPDSKTTGAPSPQYAAKVYAESRRTQQAVRSGISQLNTARAETTKQLKNVIEAKERAEKQQQTILSTYSDRAQAGKEADALGADIRTYNRQIAEYEQKVKNIDSARQVLARDEMQAQKQAAVSAFEMTRATKGPVDTARISSTKQYQSEPKVSITTQRQRPEAQTGVQDKLFANPLYMQDAENYTRPPLFTEDVRKERSKALQGQEGKLFGNLNFVTYEDQKKIDKEKTKTNFITGKPETRTSYSLSLVEAPQLYSLDFGGGAKLEGLTKADVELIQKNWKIYNEKQKAQARQEILSALSTNREFVKAAREKGYGLITINTTAGVKDLPINKDTTRILTRGKYNGAEITGAGLAPTIPEGFTLAGSLLTPVLLPESKTIKQDKSGKITEISQVGPASTPEQPKEDPIGQALQSLTQLKSNNPLVQAGKGVYKEALGSVASSVNFERYAGSKLTESLTGKPELVSYTTIPRLTASSEFAGGLSFAAIKAVQKGNWKYFPSAAAEAFENATKLAKEQGLIETAAGAATFLAPIPKTGQITKLAAIKSGSLPLYYEGGKTINAVREISLGYGSKTLPIGGRYAKEFGGKFYLGGFNPALIQVEKISAPLERFNRFEPTAYTPTQQKMFRKTITYAEQTGATKPGFVATQKQLESEVKRQGNINFPMKKTLPDQIIEQLPAGQPTYNVAATLGKLTRTKVITPIKGSIVAVLGKDRLARPAKDIDAEINAAKQADAEKKLIKAKEAILQTDVGKERTLAEMGAANIAIGLKDYSKPTFATLELPKDRFYKSEITIAHGTTRKSAVDIIKEGADPFQRPFGEPAFFGTTSKDILKTFASERVVLGKVSKSDILFYKNIPKRDRLQILRKARQEAKAANKPSWLTYQEAVSEYAKARGFKGATKPYHTTNPASPKFEYIIFEKDVFKPTKIIKPTSYEIKSGTEKELINLITPKEQIKNVLGLSDKGKVFGRKYDTGKIKIKIPKSKEKLITKTPFYQLQTKAAEITGIETAESLAKAQNLEPAQIERMLGGGKFVMSPEGHRGKSIFDFYMQARDAAKIQFFKGNRKGALESAKTMRMIQQYYFPLAKDFGAALREYKPTLETSAPETVPSLTERIGSSAAAGGKSAPSFITPGARPAQPDREKKSPYSSPYSKPSARPALSRSGMVSSYSSGLGSRSALSSAPSAKSVLSGKVSSRATISSSATIPSSGSSGFTSSGKTASARSPSILSGKIASPLSGRTESPKTKSPRPFYTSSPTISSPSPALSPVISPLIIPIIQPKPLPVPKRLPVPIPKPFLKNIDESRKKEKRKGLAEFIGNVPVSEITGVYKRPEILYGEKRASRLAGIDIRGSGKGVFSKGKRATLGAQVQKNVFTPSKKQSKNFLKL